MSTQNVDIGSDWVKIAETADTDVCAQPSDNLTQVEYATTTADAAPDSALTGHRLTGTQVMTRIAIGDGYLWARLYATAKEGVLVVSGSSIEFS